jgi:hypothetical protein
LRDCASNESHQGTETKQILTTLSTSQVRAGFVQCDLYRGIAAGLPADKVFFSPFPLARTSIVVATKAWFLLDADSRETRLQRYLNEELEALHDAPFDPDDEASRKYVETRTADYLAIGATADLRLGLRKNPKSWHAPFLVHSGQRDTEAPASETQLVQRCSWRRGLVLRTTPACRTLCCPQRLTAASTTPGCQSTRPLARPKMASR